MVTTIFVAWKLGDEKYNKRVVPPPSSVICPCPSRVVLTSVRNVFWDVSLIVAGPPQLKRMTPPVAKALASAVSVQLAALPEPTVAVVARVSSPNGVRQTAGGLEVEVPVGVALAWVTFCSHRPSRERKPRRSRWCRW